MSKYKNYYNTATNTKQVAKKKTKKDWTYWVVVLALAFTFLGSILGTIAFAKSFVKDSKQSASTFHSVNYELDNNNNSSFSASAFDSNQTIINPGFETIERFTASNVFVPMVRYSYSADTGTYNNTIANIFNFSFTSDYTDNHDGGMADSYDFRLDIQPFDNLTTNYYLNYQRVVNNDIYISNGYFPFRDLIDLQDSNLNNINYPNSILYSIRFGSRTNSIKYQCYFRINLKSGDNYQLLSSPITRVDIGSEKVDWSSASSRKYISAFSGSTNKDLYYFNTLKYYQGEYLAYEFGFLTYDLDGSSQLLENRTYYTLSGIENKSDYQLGYNNGKLDGVREGIASGTEDGFERGKYVGEQIGYDKGFRDGLNESNSNNFYSLIGAVIDVPISTLQGLLNFELLGFNLFNFLTALLTLGLIIFVVRLFI